MQIHRRQCRQISVGGVKIGGGAPVSIQSMTKTDTRDAAATLRQIRELKKEGCDLIRVAVPDRAAALAFQRICARSPLPVIADIHFDHRLALAAVAAGAAAIRLNPGNIGPEWKVKEVVKACREKGVPIRVGANTGSLPPDLERRYGPGSPQALAEAALQQARLIEKAGWAEIKVSVKAFGIHTTIAAFRILAKRVDYPFHLGITEAGPLFPGTVRSAIGIGALLLEGIGDTIRVSLTAHPRHELKAGREILRAVGARDFGPIIVSCPTCGRCEVDLPALVKETEKRIASLSSPLPRGLTVALMGCVVNGPGEAQQADLGIAFSRRQAAVFVRGKIARRCSAEAALEILIDRIAAGGGGGGPSRLES
jgi:(E)-4-hydroxy-3-methylbut-2-enyl-diphosphate synthase